MTTPDSDIPDTVILDATQVAPGKYAVLPPEPTVTYDVRWARTDTSGSAFERAQTAFEADMAGKEWEIEKEIARWIKESLFKAMFR